MRLAWAVGIVGVVLVGAKEARPDPLPPSAARIATPGRSVASDDTAEAIVVNPANLGFLPAPELRWSWVRCPDDAVMVGCGHASEMATPLFFNLATAFRIDLVQPPWGGPDSAGVGF